MTKQQHPITPPPELVEQWFAEQRGLSEASRQQIATRAAQWAADQELQACCEWLDYNCPSVGAHHLCSDRRPKPPVSKEEALADLVAAYEKGYLSTAHYENIRRALEQLDG